MEARITRFIKDIAEVIEEKFGSGCSVQFYEIVKDKKTAAPVAVICEPGATTGTAVHIGPLLSDLERGEISLQEAVRSIVKIYEEIRNIGTYTDIIMKPDKEAILSRVAYRLVNTEKNAGKLADIPHREMLDLSAVYKVVVKDNGIETASIIVDKTICTKLGISEQELEDAANLNTELRGFPGKPFMAVFPGELDGMDIDSGCLWVLTNRAHREGAAVMLYPYYFRRLARRLGADLYAVPSSCHEVIAAPVKDEITPDSMRRIAGRIKALRSIPEESISENIYRYRRKTGRFEITGI